jgi:small conductance mechanosensitive channel
MNYYLLNLFNLVSVWFVNYSPKVLSALLIFFIGQKIAKVISRLFSKAIAKSSAGHVTGARFVQDVIYYIFYIVIIIVAMSQLGLPTSSFIAIFGSMGLAIGLAFKDSLSNFASGVMIIIFRPIVQGDFIMVGGESGTVSVVGVFQTTIVTTDNKKITIPNNSITTGNIYNFSANPTRRVDVTIKIGYNDDIKTAKSAIQEVIDDDNRVLKEPVSAIVVSNLAENGVEITARMWCCNTEYWNLFFDMNEKIKEATQKAGLTIPVPVAVKMVG